MVRAEASHTFTMKKDEVIGRWGTLLERGLSRSGSRFLRGGMGLACKS